ncbi:hypothetical protein PIB30_114604 [Stylosanthes scabra]|uniref:Uncharacterized protein n=1 Tax=Stylosanthes scabra TaxID=79078 RepID=A0ABU6R2W8_9FABA|nr:hypothetical protein [Stylosanthes scabra]
MQALIPDWMRAQSEVHTWRSAVPVVCFNFVHMHHIDRVIRQYGDEQPVPRLPVDVTRYMASTGRGDDVWWPQRLSTWYEGWPEVLVTVHGGGDPRGHQQYYEWFARVADIVFVGILITPLRGRSPYGSSNHSTGPSSG